MSILIAENKTESLSRNIESDLNWNFPKKRETITGQIISINFKKEGCKERVSMDSARLIEQFGLEDDKYAGTSDLKQVSLVAIENINKHTVCPKLKDDSRKLTSGDFGENITVEGIDFKILRKHDFLKMGPDVILQISKIGRNCKWNCALNHKNVGGCFILKEGIFGRVIKGGVIKKNDKIRVINKSNKFF